MKYRKKKKTNKNNKEYVRIYMKSLLFDVSTFDLCLCVQGLRPPVGWLSLIQ